MATQAALAVATPAYQRLLVLGEHDDKKAQALQQNHSGLAGRDGWLWLGGDEGRSLVRVVDQGGDRFGGGQRFRLRDFNLAESGEAGEADIEGLCLDGDRLWLVGSHSLRRWKNDEAREKRLRVDPQRSRNAQLLGCLRLDAQGLPLAGQRLAFHPRRGVDALFKKLESDPLIAPFSAIPSKDNGLDIEGITARDDRVLLGLRGPVLRGIALVADVTLSGLEPHDGSDAIGNPLRLAHLRLRGLDLRGLAVRDLAVLPGSDDVLILAGPTMTLAGPCQLYRWRDAFTIGDGTCEGFSVTTPTPVLWIRDGSPHERHNKPEGLDLERIEGNLVAWIAYDNPDKHRCRGAGRSTQLDGFVLGEER